MQRFKILGVEMEIAARCQSEAIADFGLQEVAQLQHARVIENKFTIAMGRSDDVGNPVGNRGLRHCQGLIDGLRPVIEAG